MRRRLSPNVTLHSTTPPPKRLRRSRRRPTPDLFLSPPKSTASPERPAKKRKTHHEEESAQERVSQGATDVLRTTKFWDNLTPRVPLCKAALKELDRRNRQATPAAAPAPVPAPASLPQPDCDIRRYARRGGPDLTDLRGGEMPQGQTRGRQNRQARGRVQKARGRGRGRVGSSLDKTSTSQTKSSSPYDAAFKQHLINHSVWPIGHYLDTGERPPPPDNLNDIVAHVYGGRSSLEPEIFTQNHFAVFQKSYDLSASEEPRSRTMECIEGLELSISSSHIKRGPVKFSSLNPLIPENLVPGNPDRAYGSRPEKLDRAIRTDLQSLILPTAAQDMACPNFIVHVKGPSGSPEIASIQAVYDGALAARGMDALWSFGRGGEGDEGGDDDDDDDDGSGGTLKAGDGKRCQDQQRTARTLTCTFAAGVLRMYAVHSRPCTGSPTDVEYISSRIGAWVMDDNLEDFRRGAAAFRNGIEWAQRKRDEAIARANRRAMAAARVASDFIITIM